MISAANPDAEDASPAAVGKLFSVSTRSRRQRAGRRARPSDRCRRRFWRPARSRRSDVTRRCVNSRVEGDVRSRAQMRQSDRQRRRSRHVLRAVAFAPIFDERDVRVRLRRWLALNCASARSIAGRRAESETALFENLRNFDRRQIAVFGADDLHADRQSLRHRDPLE